MISLVDRFDELPAGYPVHERFNPERYRSATHAARVEMLQQELDIHSSVVFESMGNSNTEVLRVLLSWLHAEVRLWPGWRHMQIQGPEGLRWLETWMDGSRRRRWLQAPFNPERPLEDHRDFAWGAAWEAVCRFHRWQKEFWSGYVHAIPLDLEMYTDLCGNVTLLSGGLLRNAVLQMNVEPIASKLNWDEGQLKSFCVIACSGGLFARPTSYQCAHFFNAVYIRNGKVLPLSVLNNEYTTAAADQPPMPAEIAGYMGDYRRLIDQVTMVDVYAKVHGLLERLWDWFEAHPDFERMHVLRYNTQLRSIAGFWPNIAISPYHIDKGAARHYTRLI